MTLAEKFLSIIVSILCILGIAFSIRFIFSGGGNEGFAHYPLMTRLHVIPGLLYLVLAPLQFSPAIRRRFKNFHRRSGQLLTVAGLILGSAALFIGIVIPFSGLPEQIVIAIFGSFYLASLIKGFQCARFKQYQAHREWMLRAFAIGLSIVTMRLIFIPILIGIGSPTDEQIAHYSIVSFTISFLLHSIFAEFWIHRTRSGSTQHRNGASSLRDSQSRPQYE